MIIAGGIQPISRLKPFGPFRSAAGSLYYVAFQEFDADGPGGNPMGGANRISVWKSVDGGATWVEQDAANRKSSAVQDATAIEYNNPWGVVYNVPHDLRTFSVVRHPVATDEMWILYVDDANAYRVSVFDMAADAWAGSSGSGIACNWQVTILGPWYYTPPVGSFVGEFETTTGDFVVLAVTGGTTTAAGGMECHTITQVFRLQGGIAGAWTAPVNMPLIPGSTFTDLRHFISSVDGRLLSLTRGAAGRLHALLGVYDDALGPPAIVPEDRFVHWLVADGAGGSGAALDLIYQADFGTPAMPIDRFNLGWDELAGEKTQGCASSIPFGAGTQVVIPVVDFNVSPGDFVLRFMYGDSQPAMPLASWSLQTVETYPGGVPLPDYFTMVEGGDVYVAYRRASDSFLVERKWDGAVLGPEVVILAQPWSVAGTWAHTSGGVTGSRGYIAATAHPASSAWGIAMASPPAPAPVVAIPSPNFIRFGRSPIKCANVWDWCLKNSECPWYQVDWAAHACIPVKCWRDENNPLHAIPEQGRELHKYGSIPLPALPSVDTQILQFRVPLGYDGIIYAVLCKYQGTGYLNGSGDLLWRFRVNEKWIKSLHSIPTELGDYTGYMQLDEFFRVQSGQMVRAYGWVSPASGIKGGAMIAALQGWYFPAQFVR